MGENGAAGKVGACRKRHEPDDFLAVDRIGHPGGRRFRHAWNSMQDRIDLQRRDIDATTDDQVLLSSDNDQVTLYVDPAKVAGVMPVARQVFDRAVRVEVANRLLQAAADDDFAELALRNVGSGFADDPHRLVLERRPKRSDLALRAAMRGGVAAFA